MSVPGWPMPATGWGRRMHLPERGPSMTGEEVSVEGDASADASLLEALEDLVSTAAELGLDLGGRTDELAAFLVGAPTCCLVTRPTGADGADGVAEAVADAVPEIRILRHTVEERADRPLCDVVVLTTPAEQALSRTEEDAVRQAAADGCRVVVLVTDVALLGGDMEQQAACSEIERFRLRPTLGPLGAQWLFHTAGGNPDPFLALVRQVLAETAGQPHRRPALRALATLVEVAAAQLEGRVEIRRRELARLRELRSRQGPVAGHLHREADLARRHALDAIRTAEQQLTQVSFVVGRRAVEWTEDGSDGVTPWESVVQPLREAWRAFRRQAEQAVPDACAGFRAECEQVLSDDRRAAATLNVGGLPSPLWAGQWSTAEIEEALAALDRCDLDGMLHRLRRCAENAMPSAARDTGERHPRSGLRGGEGNTDFRVGTRGSEPWGPSRPEPWGGDGSQENGGIPSNSSVTPDVTVTGESPAQQADLGAEPGAGARQENGNPSRAQDSDPDSPKTNGQLSEPPSSRTDASQERAAAAEPPCADAGAGGNGHAATGGERAPDPAVAGPGQAAELVDCHLRSLHQAVLQTVNNGPQGRVDLISLLQTGMETVLDPQIKVLAQTVEQVVAKAARADADYAEQIRAAWLEASAAALANRHSWSAGQARIDALRAWCRTEERLVP